MLLINQNLFPHNIYHEIHYFEFGLLNVLKYHLFLHLEVFILSNSSKYIIGFIHFVVINISIILPHLEQYKYNYVQLNEIHQIFHLMVMTQKVYLMP